MSDDRISYSSDPLRSAFTHLGKALQFLSQRAESAWVGMSQIPASLQEMRIEIPHDTAGAEVVEQIKRERQRVEGKRSEVQKVLGDLLGQESSPGRLDEYLKIRSQMLEVIAAEQQGMVDTRESSEALKHLRKQLVKERAGLSDEHTDQVDKMEGSSLLKVSTAGKASGMASHLGDITGVTEAVQKAGSTAWGQTTGMLEGLIGLSSSLPIAGGLFGMMLFGYQETDRLKTQAGEMTNLAVAAGGDAHSRGMAWMTGFQEKAQHFYGISRKEIQGNLKNFINSGIALDDIFAAEDKTLGEVGHDAVTLSVAIDRHFEMSAGTTSRMAATMVSQYGENLGKAVHKLELLAFAAQRGGFGVNAFVSWTLSASQQVKHLGVTMDEVGVAALELKRSYQAQGAGNEASGTMAKEGISGVTGYLSHMGLGREVWMAEQLGHGTGLEGREKMREGAGQNRPGELLKMTQAFYKEAMKASAGDEKGARFYLEKQTGSFEGARAIFELGKGFKEGTKLEELSAADKKKLVDTYKVEGQKTSDLGKGMREMLNGMAKMGQGFLAMLTNFVAIAIVGMKTLPVMIAGTDAEREAVFTKFKEHGMAIKSGWGDVMSGSGEALRGLQHNLGPLLDPIMRAIEWQYIGGMKGVEDAVLAAPTDSGNAQIFDKTIQSLTGAPMTDAQRKILFPPGLSQDEASWLLRSPEGKDELKRRWKKAIEQGMAAKPNDAPQKSGGGGPAGRPNKPVDTAFPSSWENPDATVIPGLDVKAVRDGKQKVRFINDAGREGGKGIPVITEWHPDAKPGVPLQVKIEVVK